MYRDLTKEVVRCYCYPDKSGHIVTSVFRGLVPHPRLLLLLALRAKVAASVPRVKTVHNRPYFSAIWDRLEWH